MDGGSHTPQVSLVQKAEDESKKFEETMKEARGIDRQLESVAKDTDSIRSRLKRMEEYKEELRELYRLKEDLRKTENELKVTKISLDEKEEELEVLLVANNELKTELSDIKEKYTRSILERDKLREKYQQLNLENEKQAQNNFKLAEELETLKNCMREIERPSNLPMRQESLTSDFSPSSGQPLKKMPSSASSTPSTIVPTPPVFNLKYLMQLLGDAADSWNQIGIQLDVPSSKLRSIKNENQQDVDRLSCTLSHWLSDTSFNELLNYDTIYDVLRSPSVNRKDLIPTEFKSKYC